MKIRIGKKQTVLYTRFSQQTIADVISDLQTKFHAIGSQCRTFLKKNWSVFVHIRFRIYLIHPFLNTYETDILKYPFFEY